MARSKPASGKDAAAPGTGTAKASAKPKKRGPTPPDRTGARKLNVRETIEALRQSAGIKSAAAQKLNVARSTLHSFIEEHPEIKEALVEICEELKDLAEGKVLQAIRANDMQTTRWYLEFQAKDRGYNRRVEHTGPDGGPIETRTRPDLSSLTDEELEVLHKLALKQQGQQANA